MKLTFLKATIAGLILTTTSIINMASAHLISYGWEDNLDGTVTLFGEHWHGDQTVAFSDNGGILITDISGSSAPFLAQWSGVLNNSNRDTMVAAGDLLGYSLIPENASSATGDWFYTTPLVIGNGTWSFLTGSNCCVDTHNTPVQITLTGISSVASGTGPSAADSTVPEPSTLAIFALGIMGLASRRFKKQ